MLKGKPSREKGPMDQQGLGWRPQAAIERNKPGGRGDRDLSKNGPAAEKWGKRVRGPRGK